MKPQSSSLPSTVYDGILVRAFHVEEENRNFSINVAYKSILVDQDEQQMEAEEEEEGVCSSPINMEHKMSHNLGVDFEKEAEEVVVEELKNVKVVSLTSNNRIEQVLFGDRKNDFKTNEENNIVLKQDHSTSQLEQNATECCINCLDSRQVVAHLASVSSTSTSSSSLTSSSCQIYIELGNKCGKCQNHEIEISKKGKFCEHVQWWHYVTSLS